MNPLGAVLAFVLAALLIWKRKLPKVAVVLLVVAAFGLRGWVGRALETVGVWINSVLDRIGSWAFGVPASNFVLVILMFIVLHDLWPKNKASRTTQGAGFALPVLGLAGAGVIGTAVGTAAIAIGNALASVATAL